MPISSTVPVIGAGTSVTSPSFRLNGQAPVITLRAANNVEVEASLTDVILRFEPATGLTVLETVRVSRAGADQPVIGASEDATRIGGRTLAMMSASCIASTEWEKRRSRLGGVSAFVSHGREDLDLSFDAGLRLNKFLTAGGAAVMRKRQSR